MKEERLPSSTLFAFKPRFAQDNSCSVDLRLFERLSVIVGYW